MRIEKIPREEWGIQITMTMKEKSQIRKALTDLSWDAGDGDGYEELYKFYKLVS